MGNIDSYALPIELNNFFFLWYVHMAKKVENTVDDCVACIKNLVY